MERHTTVEVEEICLETVAVLIVLAFALFTASVVKIVKPEILGRKLDIEAQCGKRSSRRANLVENLTRQLSGFVKFENPQDY